MSDIELRFLERAEPSPEYGPAIHRMVRVLQWRKLVVVVRGGGMTFTDWTEWEDVPLVKEEP